MKTTKAKARLIAHYLPQYHPIPENDEWWGAGFTEWVTTSSARPLFRGHYQPRLPGELGFYDLRLPQTREDQANLARAYGIEAFCYWHYWLGNGRRILEGPFDSVVESGAPDFPFCLGWANHDWKGTFFGAQRRELLKQQYLGENDYRAHFDLVSRAFHDSRYFRVNGCPLFLIYRPRDVPDCRGFTDFWRKLAGESGLPGIYFVGEGITPGERESFGLDAVSACRHRHIEMRNSLRDRVVRKFHQITGIERGPLVYDYADAMKYFLKDEPLAKFEHPSIVTGWDTTARLGRRATIFTNNTPELFQRHVREVISKVEERGNAEEDNLIFVKSWNEWAEGNYLEPDRRYGRAFLEALKVELF